MSEPEEHCYRPDCVDHDYERNTHTLSWEAVNAALASVYPEWYIPADRPIYGLSFQTPLAETVDIVPPHSSGPYETPDGWM